MRAIIASFLLFVSIPAYAQSFSTFLDVVGHPQEHHISVLQARGTVEGYGYGMYRPDILINRAEFLKLMMLAAFGEEEYGVRDPRCFVDFLEAELWFWRHACEAKIRGVIDGYGDGSFGGMKVVNLAEAIKMTVDAWQIRLPVSVTGYDHWFDPYMAVARERGLFEHLPDDPAHLMTRGDMAVLIVEMVSEDRIAYVESDTEEPREIVEATCGNGVIEGSEQCDDGNLENRDGCSELCIIVPEPVRHASLRIVQKPYGELTQSEGSDDIVVLGFEATAGRQDVFLTGLTVESSAGALSQAQNYKLVFVGSREALSTANADGNALTFDTSIELKEGITREFEIRADIATTASPTTLSVGFKTGDPAFVRAVGAEDGRDLVGIHLDDTPCTVSLCWIRVLTEENRQVTVTERGNLFVTAGSSVQSRQLVVGDTTPVLFGFELRADGEDIVVTDIAIAGGEESIEYLELLREGSDEAFATLRESSCNSANSGQFCGTNLDLIVPQYEELDIEVRAKIRSLNPEDISGNSFALYLTSGISPQPAIEAHGRGSLDSLVQNNGDSDLTGEVIVGRDIAGPNNTITGTTHKVAFPVFFGIENAMSDPDGSAIPVGNVSIGGFRFSSPSSDVSGSYKVHLQTLVFTLNADNVLLDQSSFALYSRSNPSATSSCTASSNTSLITVTCASLDSSDIGAVVEPGSSLDLLLEANVLDASIDAGSSTLQLMLQRLGNPANPGTVVWSDGTTVFDWIDVPLTTVRSVLYRLSN